MLNLFLARRTYKMRWEIIYPSITISANFQGAGRVAFSNQQSYISAISARFVQLQHGDIDKRVEVCFGQ